MNHIVAGVVTVIFTFALVTLGWVAANQLIDCKRKLAECSCEAASTAPQPEENEDGNN